MNRLLAAFSPRTTASEGCCPECDPVCNSRKLRAEARDRALQFRQGR